MATKPISMRFREETREMLSKLAKQFTITEADVMRMAIKQLHDRTFPPTVPTADEIVERILMGG